MCCIIAASMWTNKHRCSTSYYVSCRFGWWPIWVIFLLYSICIHPEHPWMKTKTKKCIWKVYCPCISYISSSILRSTSFSNVNAIIVVISSPVLPLYAYAIHQAISRKEKLFGFTIIHKKSRLVGAVIQIDFDFADVIHLCHIMWRNLRQFRTDNIVCRRCRNLKFQDMHSRLFSQDKILKFVG